MLTVLYFASLREKTGLEQEQLEMNEQTSTVAGLRNYLAARDGGWADWLGPEVQLLAAINQEMVSNDSRLDDGDEIAFFPPVTGG